MAADYGRPDLLAGALHEGDRVFMTSVHEGPERRVPLHRSFVEAAARAGVAQLVYLSFANASRDATFLHARSHGETEEMLADSGVPWTAIRNTMYADHIPGWFDPDGVAREPLGEARMSFSYRPELAKAIAVVLTEPGHEEHVYDITTPESVSLHDLARIAAEVTGDPYAYEPATDEEWDERWRARRPLGLGARSRPHLVRGDPQRRAGRRHRRLPPAHRPRAADGRGDRRAARRRAAARAV